MSMCLHKVQSPPALRLGGIRPTGPLPETVNFWATLGC